MGILKDLSKGWTSHFQARNPHLPSHQTFTLSCKFPPRWTAASHKYSIHAYVHKYVSRSEKKRKNRELPLFAEPAQVEGGAGGWLKCLLQHSPLYLTGAHLSVPVWLPEEIRVWRRTLWAGEHTPVNSLELSFPLWSDKGSLAGYSLRPEGPMLEEPGSRAVPDMHWQLSACRSFKESSWIRIKMWSYAGGIVSTTWLKFSSSSGSQLLYF